MRGRCGVVAGSGGAGGGGGQCCGWAVSCALCCARRHTHTLWRSSTFLLVSQPPPFTGSVDVIEQSLPPLDSGAAGAARQLAVGVGVGVAATAFNAPFDVVKSRFQSQVPGAARRYTRVFPSLARIAREEGPGALYRGFAPKALRLGVGQSVGLVVFQRCLVAFGAQHSAEDDAAEARAAALIAD